MFGVKAKVYNRSKRALRTHRLVTSRESRAPWPPGLDAWPWWGVSPTQPLHQPPSIPTDPFLLPPAVFLGASY